MKKLSLIAGSAVIAAMSLPALADITLSGDARFRVDSQDASTNANAPSTVDRDSRLRLYVEGGNDTAGFSTNLMVETSDASNGGTSVSTDSDTAYGWINFGSAELKVGNWGVGGGIGLHNYGEDDDSQAIQLSGGNDMFNVFIRSNKGHSTADVTSLDHDDANNDGVVDAGELTFSTTAGDNEKSEYASYGIDVSLDNGISFAWTYRGEVEGGADDETGANLEYGEASFSSIYVSADLGSISAQAEILSSGAENGNAQGLIVSAPLGDYSVGFAYATFEENYAAGGDFTPFGTQAWDGWFDADPSGSGVTGEDNRWIGFNVGGSVGNFGLSATAGSYEDNDNATKNSFYELGISYQAAKNASIGAQLLEVGGVAGVGAQVNWSF